MLRVSSGFQTLENNKTTRPAASWFQMFSRVWKPDETLALVFEIVLKKCTRHISRHLKLHRLSADKVVDSEFKLLLARAGNVIAFVLELLCSIILATDTS